MKLLRLKVKNKTEYKVKVCNSNSRLVIFFSFSFQIVNVGSDGFLTLMDDKGQLRSDIKNDDGDLGKEIKDRFEKDENFMVTLACASIRSQSLGIKIKKTNKILFPAYAL